MPKSESFKILRMEFFSSYSQTVGPYQTTPAYLDIPRLSQQDAGVYICVGKSSAGVTERRVRIDILPERGDNPGK